MAELEKCWACADDIFAEDVRLIRAKKAECEWVIKRVCVECYRFVGRWPNYFVEVDGEFWTMRSYAPLPEG